MPCRSTTEPARSGRGPVRSQGRAASESGGAAAAEADAGRGSAGSGSDGGPARAAAEQLGGRSAAPRSAPRKMRAAELLMPDGAAGGPRTRAAAGDCGAGHRPAAAARALELPLRVHDTTQDRRCASGDSANGLYLQALEVFSLRGQRGRRQENRRRSRLQWHAQCQVSHAQSRWRLVGRRKVRQGAPQLERLPHRQRHQIP